jgi:hypothetical protein
MDRITFGLILLGILVVIWVALVLNHKFARPKHRAEIDAERARRAPGIITGHPGSSGLRGGGTGGVTGPSEDDMY